MLRRMRIKHGMFPQAQEGVRFERLKVREFGDEFKNKLRKAGGVGGRVRIVEVLHLGFVEICREGVRSKET